MPIDPEIHKKFHAAPLQIERRYRAISLYELLKNIRKMCDVIIDLAYYSYLTKELDTLDHLIWIVREAKSMIEEATVHVSLIVRKIKDAKNALALYRYAVAIEKIIDASLDIAYISLSGHNPSEEVVDAIRYLSDEFVIKIVANEKMQIKTSELIERYPIDILLRIRNGEREYFYAEDIRKGDVLYIRGYKSVLNEFLEDFGYEPLREKEVKESLRNVISKIVYLMETNKGLLDIAHAAMISKDESLIREIDEMESMLDTYHIELLEEMIKKPPTDNNLTNLSLLWLVTKLEDITDSIEEIALLSSSDPDIMSVFYKLGEAIDERCMIVEIKRPSRLQNLQESIKKFGAAILAIKSKGEWTVQTRTSRKDHELTEKDLLLVLYPKEFEEEVIRELEKESLVSCNIR